MKPRRLYPFGALSWSDLRARRRPLSDWLAEAGAAGLIFILLTWLY